MREARIDLAALADNIRNSPAAVVDVSGDAFGHGAERVARVAVDCGAAIVVRDAGERSGLAAIGIDSHVLGPALIGSDDSAFGLHRADRPVMRVSARVVSIKTIDAGEPVSYGYTWRAPARTTLALVPLGYADGVQRSASNRESMWLAGAMRPIVGRIAMDVSVLDLGTDAAEPGDEAILFGDPLVGQTAAEWGEGVGIDALSVTSAIGARVSRRWVG